MSLTDLKKKNQNRKTRKLSIDDFINDAEAYALGCEIRSKEAQRSQVSSSGKRTKPATFTLSPDCIKQLDTLSKESGISKSRIIRILAKKAASSEKDKTVKKLQDSDVD